MDWYQGWMELHTKDKGGVIIDHKIHIWYLPSYRWRTPYNIYGRKLWWSFDYQQQQCGDILYIINNNKIHRKRVIFSGDDNASAVATIRYRCCEIDSRRPLLLHHQTIIIHSYTTVSSQGFYQKKQKTPLNERSDRDPRRIGRSQ